MLLGSKGPRDLAVVTMTQLPQPGWLSESDYIQPAVPFGGQTH